MEKIPNTGRIINVKNDEAPNNAALNIAAAQSKLVVITLLLQFIVITSWVLN